MTLAFEDERVPAAAAAGTAGEGQGRSADLRCFFLHQFEFQLSSCSVWDVNFSHYENSIVNL